MTNVERSASITVTGPNGLPRPSRYIIGSSVETLPGGSTITVFHLSDYAVRGLTVERRRK